MNDKAFLDEMNDMNDSLRDLLLDEEDMNDPLGLDTLHAWRGFTEKWNELLTAKAVVRAVRDEPFVLLDLRDPMGRKADLERLSASIEEAERARSPDLHVARVEIPYDTYGAADWVFSVLLRQLAAWTGAVADSVGTSSDNNISGSKLARALNRWEKDPGTRKVRDAGVLVLVRDAGRGLLAPFPSFSDAKGKGQEAAAENEPPTILPALPATDRRLRSLLQRRGWWRRKDDPPRQWRRGWLRMAIIGSHPVGAEALPWARNLERRFVLIRQPRQPLAHAYGSLVQNAEETGDAIGRVIAEHIPRAPWRLCVNSVTGAEPPPPVRLRRIHAQYGWDGQVPAESAAVLILAAARAAGLKNGIADLPPGTVFACGPNPQLTRMGLRKVELHRSRGSLGEIELHAEAWIGRGDLAALRDNPRPWPLRGPVFRRLPRNGMRSEPLRCVALLLGENVPPEKILDGFARINDNQPWNGQRLNLDAVEKLLGVFWPKRQPVRTESPAAVRLACDRGAAAYLCVGSQGGALGALARLGDRLYDPNDFVGVTGDFVRGDTSIRFHGALVVTSDLAVRALVRRANSYQCIALDREGADRFKPETVSS